MIIIGALILLGYALFADLSSGVANLLGGLAGAIFGFGVVTEALRPRRER